MAFDACMMRAVISEISADFSEARIEKVLQPRNDEINMVIHRGRSSRRLVFNVGPNAPRLQLSDKQKENPLKAECYLPSVVDEALKSGKVTVKVQECPDKWFGVTYKEDTPALVEALKKLTEEGMYPSPIWG